MSVYIKGMEMPQGCDDCYFCGEMGICSVLVATHINSGVVGEYRYSEFERPPFCPLIPVPDHGRLIDADALIDAVELDDLSTLSEVMHIKEVLRDVPTIIPASGGNENE